VDVVATERTVADDLKIRNQGNTSPQAKSQAKVAAEGLKKIKGNQLAMSQ